MKTHHRMPMTTWPTQTSEVPSRAACVTAWATSFSNTCCHARSVDDPQTWQVGPWDHERYRIEFPHYIHYIPTISNNHFAHFASPHSHQLSSSFIIFHLQFATSSGELFVTMAFAHLQSELLPKPSAHGKVLPQARCIGT
jgi:hypothetical protein